MTLRTLSSASFEGKTVLLRTDFNVPLREGKVQDDTRLLESLPTLRFLMEKGARIGIVTHLGRPKGQVQEDLRLTPVAARLAELLQKPVRALSEAVGPEVQEALAQLKNGELVMLENVRFYSGEEANDPAFAETLAQGFELYVSDAFATLHRAHASTVGVTRLLPSYAGLLVQKEVEVLSGLLNAPEAPVALVTGGAKIDTKIGVLEKFLERADFFLIGGALANTFLAAQGFAVGKSLCETEKIPVAKAFLEAAAAAGKKVFLPEDVVVSTALDGSAAVRNTALSDVASDELILDLGVQTQARFKEILGLAKTVIWNGPMGLYEQSAFEQGTAVVARAVAVHPGIKVIGGGDTLDAVNHFGLDFAQFTHVSTGGGAMLEFLEGKSLPGVLALMD